MYEFFKSDAYINLISELQLVEEFFNQQYTSPVYYDHFQFSDNYFSIGLIKNSHDFYKEINKIQISTPERDLINYSDFICEVRENILKRIAKIPPLQLAREIFIKVFETNCNKPLALFGGPDTITFFSINEKDEDIEFKLTPEQLIDKWKNGWNIRRVSWDELIIGELCQFLQTDRDLVQLNLIYKGVDLFKGLPEIDISKVADELIQGQFIHPMFKRTFKKLIKGNEYMEPIKWTGNLSELNKFIKAVTSLTVKNYENKPIEWKSLSKIFVVNNEFPDPDKLKGASNVKIGSSRELQPFWSYLNKAILKE